MANENTESFYSEEELIAAKGEPITCVVLANKILYFFKDEIFAGQENKNYRRTRENLMILEST